VDIAQIVAHEAGESNLCREGSDAFFPNDFGEDLLLNLLSDMQMHVRLAVRLDRNTVR